MGFLPNQGDFLARTRILAKADRQLRPRGPGPVRKLGPAVPDCHARRLAGVRLRTTATAGHETRPAGDSNGAWEDAWSASASSAISACRQRVGSIPSTSSRPSACRSPRKALDDGEFEQALEHARKAAHLRGRGRAGGSRRHSVGDAGRGSPAVRHQAQQRYAGHPRHDCADDADSVVVSEASFWQALCDLREGTPTRPWSTCRLPAPARRGRCRRTKADISTPDAAPPPTSPFIDPPLYLGAIHLTQGQPKEAMRFLTEANRMDPGCPVVTLQLGAAMIAAGGDTQFAVLRLQKSLGPRGLGHGKCAGACLGRGLSRASLLRP